MNQVFKVLKPIKTIALVAHDHKKDDLAAWVAKHKDALIGHKLLATGTTGRKIEEVLGVSIEKLMIAQGHVDMIIFFWDPMEAQPHDSDVKALLRIGVVWNIPMACDPSTADFMISSPFMNSEYIIEVTDYSEYLNRKLEV